MSSDEGKEEQTKNRFHRTKIIQFLGRTTPIILQNDNGPCPLLAICNVLLLRNSLNLSPDMTEISQERLLSLVAERLIDTSCNINNKDTGYIQNQQQNIADAINLLPRLTTGIDVNIKFKRIDDFEFTPECAIFDLFDIPLYHGWIVDPQDCDTANAVGSKSYNTLMGELVELETKKAKDERKCNYEEDFVDFAAATTATLGVPSPCLSRAKSFDESPSSDADHMAFRKGDLEEEAEVLRVLNLSKIEISEHSSSVMNCAEEICTNINMHHTQLPQEDTVDTSNVQACDTKHETLFGIDYINSSSEKSTSTSHLTDSTGGESSYLSPGSLCDTSPLDQKKHAANVSIHDIAGNHAIELFHHSKMTECDIMIANESHEDCSRDGDQSSSEIQPSFSNTVFDTRDKGNNIDVKGIDFFKPSAATDSSDRGKQVEGSALDGEAPPDISEQSIGSDLFDSRQKLDVLEGLILKVNGKEPIYEGEEGILDSSTIYCEGREPIYEGEAVLANKDDIGSSDITVCRDVITSEQGELVRNFLKNSASQLTIHGLFCLQDGLKECELCIFFRNNHFSTMFKIEGELYLLVTDLGYLNQTDLVWEKFNEVNGDAIFMTGNFREFKLENLSSKIWDEQNVLASTSDYISSLSDSVQADSDISSDLQLAIALQQEEFEQQTRQDVEQVIASSSSSSRKMVIGSQKQSSSGSNSGARQESKSSKDGKCTVM